MAGIKRLADIVVALLVLILFSPIILVVAILIRFNLGSPIFFRQQRPGLHGKPFQMIKFRTMRDAVGKDGQPLPDEERMTRFGNLLRKISLDELPELWNVVRGEMSLVGPRPLLMQYLERYSERQKKRHDVRPGVTGWAQVNGRNAVDWDTRFEMDVWYVENWSLMLDLKILVLTVKTVLKRDGVSAEGHVTMPEFMGPSRSAE
ncbi:MAG: sugar transferase [Fimbriimonadaceae bacterium]